MARRVFVHIGLPKTGTSYLQSILWSRRDKLLETGLLIPGRERRDHLWSSLDVRDDPRMGRRNPRAPRAWRFLRDEIGQFEGDALISHEFFCSASQEQAERMVHQLTPAEVHVVVTAREPLGLFTSSWQEHLKNKGTTPIGDYSRTVSDDPTVVWNWRALDLGLVLGRWGPAIPADRVHVITAPDQGRPRTDLWDRFRQVVGIDLEVAPGDGFANVSMGVAEAETLRRVNARLDGFDRAFDRGVWIRSFLADGLLAPREGDRFWPGEDQVEDCRRRGDAAVELVRREGYDVVGDLEALRVPEDLSPRRHPDSVTEDEVAAVAVDLVAQLMGEVRERSARPPARRGRSRRRRVLDRVRGR